MAFDDLRERLRDQWLDVSAKVQESQTYNTLRERFESQTPAAQKLIIAGVVGFTALFFLSFPMSYLSSSSETLEIFEENQTLIKGLLKSARSAAAPPPLGPPISSTQLQDQLGRSLQTAQILPEQIGDMQSLPENPAGHLAPDIVQQTGIAAQVKNLNLKQIIQVTNAVQNMGPGFKLMGLDIVQSANQSYFYDIILKVVHFGLGAGESTADLPNERKARPKKGAGK